MHVEICNAVTHKSEDHREEQFLLLGAQTECFLCSYGLVAIGMSSLDGKFFQSKRFEEFKSRVLRRLVDISKEKYTSMNLDMGIVKKTAGKSQMQRTGESNDWCRVL